MLLISLEVQPSKKKGFMGKSHLGFETLHIGMVDHEVELMEKAFGVLRVAGVQMDATDFVTSYLKFLGYKWSWRERIWIKEDRLQVAGDKKKEELHLSDLVGFAAEPAIKNRADSIRPWHELGHLVWAYNYAQLRATTSIDLIAYLDGIARSYNREWDEESQQYTKIC